MDHAPAPSHTPVSSTTFASSGPFDSTTRSPGTNDGAYFLSPTTVGYIDDGPEVVLHSQPPEVVRTYEEAVYKNAEYQNAEYQNAEYQNAANELAADGNEKEYSREKRICGVARMTFILSVVLAVVVVVAALGGGVGGSLAVKAARESRPTVTVTVSGSNSPATTTATSSTSSASASATDITVPTTGTVALDCPSLTGRTQNVSLKSAPGATWTFSIACYADYLAETGGNGIDIMSVLAYTLNDCITACATYNANMGRDGCVAVEFRSDLTSSLAQWDGNCWLKNSTGEIKTYGADVRNAGARLTGSSMR